MRSCSLFIFFFAMVQFAVAQDTTGGTRANVVIPLHSVPEKSSAPIKPYSGTDTATVTGAPVDATERKLLRGANARNNRAKKAAARSKKVQPR